jgi:ABC-type nitrate/sulfonate/bicarbonate transport system substrate-binding protein
VADALIVNCSPTAKSLPIRVGLREGIFARYGIDLRLVSADSSREQRSGLARGDFHVVHVAVDNAIAMREVDKLDVVVFIGGDSGMNELFVQSDIGSIAEIQGGRLVVDAPDTAFALQAYKILEDHGLARGRDYQVIAVGRGELRIEAMRADKANTAAILNLPYSLEARRLGLRSLGDTTQFIGPYQAGSAFAMRAWAEVHRDQLIRYIAAYLEGLRRVLDPRNHQACAEILVEDLGTERDIANETVELLRRPGFGLHPEAAIDEAGLRNTIALRASQQAGSRLGDPQEYIDLSYYAAALALAKPKTSQFRNSISADRRSTTHRAEDGV